MTISRNKNILSGIAAMTLIGLGICAWGTVYGAESGLSQRGSIGLGTRYKDALTEQMRMYRDSAGVRTPQQETPVVIGFFETIQDAIGADQADPIDFLLFSIASPEQPPTDQQLLDIAQPYVITLQSPDFPVRAVLLFVDETTPESTPRLVQGAFVDAPGGQVQYSGVLKQAGTYAISIDSVDEMTPLGSYTVSLGTQINSPACTDVLAASPPIEIGLDKALTCELGRSDRALQDANGGVRFAKLFAFQAPSGPLTVNAISPTFTPVIQALDPNTNQPITEGANALTFDFPLGAAVIAVTSAEAEASGPFVVRVSSP